MKRELRKKLLKLFSESLENQRLVFVQQESNWGRKYNYYSTMRWVNGVKIKFYFSTNFHISLLIHVEIITEHQTTNYRIFTIPFTEIRTKVHDAIRKFNGIPTKKELKESRRMIKERNKHELKTAISIILKENLDEKN